MPTEDISIIKNIVKHEYNRNLAQLPILPLSEKMSALDVKEYVWLFHMSEFAPGGEEDYDQKISIIMDTLYLIGATCVLIVQCREGKADFYLGVVNKNNDQRLVLMKNVLMSGFEEHFHGSKLEELDIFQTDEKIGELCSERFDTQCITSISNSAILSDGIESKEQIKGIEHLLDSIQDETFTLVVIADPVSRGTVLQLHKICEEITTNLCESVTMSKQVSNSYNHTRSLTEEETKSQSKGATYSQSKSVDKGWNTSETVSDNTVNTLLSVVGGVAGAVTRSRGLPVLINMLSVPEGRERSEAVRESENKASSTTGTTQMGKSTQEGQTDSSAFTVAESIQEQRQDYVIKAMRSYLEKSTDWLEKSAERSTFDCCAYVISSSAAVNARIAGHYQALTQEEGERLTLTAINTWAAPQSTKQLRDYISHFTHPIFKLSDKELVSPATLMRGIEVGKQLALPRKSVLNLPVAVHVAYGKDIVIQDGKISEKSIRLGVLSYMGKSYPNREVLLDIDSLASHTFITGTNGSGKSNAVYQLMTKLMEQGIKCLVIEPAKGEYKNIFGMRPDVRVFGTNMRKTPLLTINPFFFNDEVEVTEHIDALLDIFNACWPMQAAMPAVLKDALERAYVSTGWDLEYSVFNGKSKIYPCFSDILEQLYTVIEDSDFSTEVKSNYKGALITRVKELCSGTFGKIFVDEEQGDEELFEGNVIIDLSRCGREETRALIIGLLILRLQEYHRREAKMNQSLKHVTILEEAHHLLRSTSTEQGMDSANLMGKSVEMIANSIAEMRTYGEGFIIIDQSPGLLDRSVIRNTNTKILLRLPEKGDRDIAGLSVNLNTEQVNEIARLPKGMAVVYQGNWREAVLCKIDRADVNVQMVYQYSFTLPSREYCRRDLLLTALLNPFQQGQKKTEMRMSEADILKLIRENPAFCNTGVIKGQILKELSNSSRINFRKRAQLLYEMLNKDSVWQRWEHYQGTASSWMRHILEDLGIKTETLYLEEKMILMMCLLSVKGRKDKKYVKLTGTWLELMDMENIAKSCKLF